MKRLFVLLLVCALVLSMPLQVSAAGDDDGEQIVLKLGHGQPEDHPYHVGSTKFAELVEEKTDGAVVVEVFPAGQMGGEREGCEALQLGTIDFYLTSTAPLANFDPSIAVFDMPFLFESKEHAREVLDSEFGQSKLDGLADVGIVGLSWFENSFIDLLGTKPFVEPEDISGQTIRVMENSILMKYMECVGANPVPMAFSEVVTSLQNGTIDGVNTPFVAVKNMGTFDGYYYTNLEAVYSPIPLLGSQATLSELPQEYQDAIVEAAKEAADYERQYIDDNYEAMQKVATDGGMEFADADVDAWIEAVVPTIQEEFVGEGKLVSPDDVDAINAFRESDPVYNA